jgi:hypothetical protein
MLQNIRSTGSAFEPFQRSKEAIDTTRKNRKNAFNNLRELFKCNIPKRVMNYNESLEKIEPKNE